MPLAWSAVGCVEPFATPPLAYETPPTLVDTSEEVDSIVEQFATPPLAYETLPTSAISPFVGFEPPASPFF
jgi:hypothetical protein